jgi:hypothetical protein
MMVIEAVYDDMDDLARALRVNQAIFKLWPCPYLVFKPVVIGIV